MPGWQLVGEESAAAFWRDAAGDVVTFRRLGRRVSPPPLSDETGLRRYCRAVAESQNAGLIEVATADGAEGPYLTYVYKSPAGTGFKFYGVIEAPVTGAMWVWVAFAVERGMTGVREAVVTRRLFEAGQLTVESYEASWARDPYDPAYAGVDRRTLRYLSDDAAYDAEFPAHPLTKVRREVRRLAGLRIPPPAPAA